MKSLHFGILGAVFHNNLDLCDESIALKGVFG